MSESSLACQISVLTVNSHICAEHRRVSCTMASWFRIRLDKAIGWLTHRQTHFRFPSDSPLASCHCLVQTATARVADQIVYFHEYPVIQCSSLPVRCTYLDMGFWFCCHNLHVFSPPPTIPPTYLTAVASFTLITSSPRSPVFNGESTHCEEDKPARINQIAKTVWM